MATKSSLAGLMAQAKKNEQTFHKEIKEEVNKDTENTVTSVSENENAATPKEGKGEETKAQKKSTTISEPAKNSFGELVESKKIETKELELIRIPRNLHGVVKKLAEAYNISMTVVVSLILDEYLNTHKKEINDIISDLLKKNLL